MPVLVSIIIPFVDELDYLREAVASALRQEIESFEIIIVCNHREMPAGEKITGELANPRIKWFHEPRLGSAFARNRGLKEASGSWVQFLDVDDLISPEKISKQLSCSEAGVIVSPHVYHFSDGKKIHSNWNPNDIWSGLLAGHLGSTSSMLWKKQAIEKAGGWDPDYPSSQEYELLFRIMMKGYKVEACTMHETIVRERPSGSITKRTAGRPMTGIRLREKIWLYLRSEGMDTPDRYNAFRNYVFKNLRALFIIDRDSALAIYRQYFQDGSFRPSVRSWTWYPLMYRILGFRRTEELMAMYRHLRDQHFHRLPHNRG